MRNKIFKFSFTFLILFCIIFTTGCSISKRDERKINRRVEKGDPYTLKEIINKYGEPTEYRDLNGILYYYDISDNFTGYACYYIGFESEEEYLYASQNGKSVKSLLIEFKKGLAIKATYQRI